MVCMVVGSCLLSNPLARMSQVSAVHQLHMNCDLRVSGFREIVCCELQSFVWSALEKEFGGRVRDGSSDLFDWCENSICDSLNRYAPNFRD
jgi:hypothetical protein